MKPRLKRVFVVHGWEFNPRMNWYPWLKDELERRGFEVHALEMPDTKTPVIGKWVKHLAKNVGRSDEDTYFVGHSIGCQTIIRYLSTQKRAGGAILVGGWFVLTPGATPTKRYRDVAEPWLKTRIEFEKAKKTCGFTAILSRDDPYVPILNAEVFKRALGAKVVLQRGKGHYTDEEGVTELPVVVKELMRMVKR